MMESVSSSEMDLLIKAKPTMSISDHIPSRHAHENRYLLNTVPIGELEYSHVHPTKKKWFVYVDQEGNEWIQLPWYLNIFHKPWANTKYVCYDLEGFGSSEIQITKEGEIKNEGSYNYRDFYLSSHFRHFLADIFPAVIYLC